DRDQIRPLTGLERADPVVHPHRARTLDSAELERLVRRHLELALGLGILAVARKLQHGESFRPAPRGRPRYRGECPWLASRWCADGRGGCAVPGAATPRPQCPTP